MGTGIAAAIPLVLRPHEHSFYGEIEAQNFSHGFIDNYTVEERERNGKWIQYNKDGSDEESKEKVYSIKNDLLIANYRSFLTEFYDLIDVDLHDQTRMALDDIPDVLDVDDFKKVFGKENVQLRLPFVFNNSMAFSVLGCCCDEYWVFYIGSYRAILEEYCTLLHFEKVLAKAMSNPLANAIKLGIFG